MNSKDIRAAFLSFFKGKKHTIEPSSPIVVKDDPSLMFTNAGQDHGEMQVNKNLFKELYFETSEKSSIIID